MNETEQKLFHSEQKAKELFKAIEDKGLIIAGKTEKQLCDEIVRIANEDFAAENHWGKKIVRTGINTLLQDWQTNMAMNSEMLLPDTL
jgi:hypothetical protein